MVAMPVQLPQDMPHECVFQASVDYQVPVAILYAIRTKEGGKAGEASKINSNNTRDYNQTQINDTWVSTFHKKEGVDPKILASDPCIGIRATAYIVRYEINRVKDFWRGVGNYHSRTQRLNDSYVNDVYPLAVRYEQMLRYNGWIK